MDYSKNISALNGATFIGPLTGNVTGNITGSTGTFTTLTAPKCYFTTLYRIGGGNITVDTNLDCSTYTISATNANVNSVTTSSGDLSLVLSGSNINCNSKNLTAVNSILVNSNGVMQEAISILSSNLSYLTSLTIRRIGYDFELGIAVSVANFSSSAHTIV